MWPGEELDLIEAFVAREPAPDQRIEIAVARLCELFMRLWASGGDRYTLRDFLPFLQAWVTDDERYSELDREVLGAFGAMKK